MSHTLYCHYTIPSERALTYWWPLIFEAMHLHDFAFSSPDYAKGVGIFNYFPSEYPSDMVSGTSSFKTLWDEIYMERNKEITVIFWSTGKDYYNLDVSLRSEQEKQLIHLFVAFSGAEVMAIPLQQARQKLLRVLMCLSSLYQTCKPCTGEAYWSFAGVEFAPWATFGKTLDLSLPDRPVHDDLKRAILRYDLRADEKSPGYPTDSLFLLDPVPVPRKRGEWQNVSLAEISKELE